MSDKFTVALVVAVAAIVGGVGAGAGYLVANADTEALSPQSAGTIVLAIQPTDNPTTIQARATELEQFLEQRTGLSIDILIPLTSTGVVEALRFGHADAAFMGAWPARLAHDIAGAEIVLAENREVIIDGQAVVRPYYYSYYVVKKESAAQTLEDLRGRTVAYPSLTSTSGYVYPVAKLVELGLVPAAAAGKQADPTLFFGDALIAGGYAQAWEALRRGQADVAVTAGDINAALFREVMDGTRIVQTQGPVPSHAVVFAEGFAGTPEGAALKAALLELRGDHKELMRKLVSGIFVEFVETSTEQHTAPLDAALDRVGLRLQEKLG